MTIELVAGPLCGKKIPNMKNIFPGKFLEIHSMGQTYYYIIETGVKTAFYHNGLVAKA